MIKKKFLILIPARSGSSKVKNKNIKLINKKPLLYYTCRFANKLKKNDNIIVGCTDSKKIVRFFDKFNIDTPFLRPKKISNKFSLDIEYINYALNFFANKKIFFFAGCILRPTSPIRFLNDYKDAERKFLNHKLATSLRSVTVSPVTPYKMWIKNKKKDFISPLIKSRSKELYNMPRQKLPKVYWQTGTYDFFKINYRKKIKSITGNKILFFDLSYRNNIDIDTIDDYQKAKELLK